MSKRAAAEPELKGEDFIALRRLSDRADNTLAVEGETCDRVPVVSLAPLLNSGQIAPKPKGD